VATKFCTVAPNICGTSTWNLFRVTLLATRILRWLPDYCNILCTGVIDSYVLCGMCQNRSRILKKKQRRMQCQRQGSEGGSRYKLPGPDCVVYVFISLGSIIICRLYKLTLSDRAQVTLQLTVFPIQCK
jgi:hypothetical protein